MADDERTTKSKTRSSTRPSADGATELHGPRRARASSAPMRHSAAHVLAEAVLDLFPGTKLGIGPVIARRLLLRLPAAPTADAGGPRRRSRSGCASSIAADHPFELSEETPRGRARGPRRARPAVQGRDRRRPGRRRRSATARRCRRRPSTGRARSSTCAAARTSPAPARSGRSSCSASPARTGAATRSARCSSASTARPGRPRRSSTSTSWRREPRRRSATTAGSASQLDLFIVPRRLAGLGVLAPEGPADLADARGRHARAAGAARLPGDLDPDPRRARSCGGSPATGTSTRDNMFIVESENQTFSLKPMNCPESTFIYRSKLRSYRDLPLRFSEYGRLHRNERSGTLSGLTRVRQFIQDDAHIYVRPDQLADEIEALLGEVREAYSWFGLTPRFAFATKPDKAIGDPALWERAEGLIKDALDRAGGDYVVKPKDGTFYAPKIDIYIDDALGREWQMATIQVDLDDAARALRPDLHRRGRPAAAPDRHPSRDLRLARAVHRHPGRALRRRLPAVAGAGPGGRHPDRRPAHRGRRGAGRRAARRAACGSRSTARRTGCSTRSGPRRSRRCRTWSCSATARSRRGRPRRGPGQGSSRSRRRGTRSPTAWRRSRGRGRSRKLARRARDAAIVGRRVRRRRSTIRSRRLVPARVGRRRTRTSRSSAARRSPAARSRTRSRCSSCRSAWWLFARGRLAYPGRR